MKLYRFLTCPDDASFCHKVTKALNQGWELHNAPQYTYDEEAKTMRCGQAVIKTVENQNYDPDMKLGEL